MDSIEGIEFNCVATFIGFVAMLIGPRPDAAAEIKFIRRDNDDITRTFGRPSTKLHREVSNSRCLWVTSETIRAISVSKSSYGGRPLPSGLRA